MEFASEEYDKQHHDGFDYMYDVQKDLNTQDAFTVDWKVKDTFGVWKKDRDVHIAMTVLDPAQEVVLAKGMPPQNKPGNPKEYTYLMVHNNGESLESQFASVIESYEDQSAILKAEALPLHSKDQTKAGIHAKAVKVTMKNGRVDYIFNSIDDNTYVADNEIEFKGFLAVISEKDGAVCYQYANDISYLKFKGQELITEDLFVTGYVSDFTKEMSIDNKIVVKLDRNVCPDRLAGAYVDIETDKIRNGFYEILSAKKNEQGLFELSIGDITLIRALADGDDVKQYFYNITEGAKFKIALVKEIG